jgi:POT family proton-dependent oligopeptide transporter
MSPAIENPAPGAPVERKGPILQPTPARRTFFGEPRELAYLALTEVWERFSYYGMTAILVLYMSQSLLMPGHIEHVAGFQALRAALEAAFGPLTPLAFAAQVFGLYSGLIYFTPVFGGLIADRWIGRRNAVMLGAVLMSAGHITMAFDFSFLIALLLLIVGCGLLKGNISTQVGELYGASDGEGRTRGFSVFSIAINVGAVLGPLVCGLVAQLYGWHAGFGLAGLLMLVGLATYVAGYRHLPELAPAREVALDSPLSAGQWRAVAALGFVMAITIFQTIASFQIFNIGLVWIDQSVNLNVLGFRVPAAWFSALYSFASIAGVPLLLAIWKHQRARGAEPGEINKIAIGAWISAAANLFVAAACALSGRASIFVPIIYDILLGLAFLYYWPTLLALVSRVAPARVKATLMGTVFLTMFVANIVIGWLGAFYERITPASFWAVHAAMAALSGLLFLLLKRRLENIFET